MRESRPWTVPGTYDTGPFLGMGQDEAERFQRLLALKEDRLGEEAAHRWAYDTLSAGKTLEAKVRMWTTLDSEFVEGGITPFRPNRHQGLICRIFERYKAQNRPLRMSILKARRWGVSSILQAIDFVLGLDEPYYKSLSLADKDEHTDTLRQMTLNSNMHLWHGLRGVMAKGKFRWPVERGSRKDFETAKAKTAGRSKGYLGSHRSEWAYCESATEINAAMMPTIPKNRFSWVADESTSAGAGGAFYKGYQSRKRGETDGIALFISWLDGDMYRKPLRTGESRLFLPAMLDEHEKVLSGLGATIEHLNMRRWILENELDGDLEKFRREYPSSELEAWGASGGSVFDRDCLLTLDRVLPTMDPPERGDLLHLDPARLASGSIPWKVL